MVTWARPTFLSVIPFRYMSSMPSWINILPASVRFLYSIHWRSALLNCHSIAAIWGPVLLDGMTAAAPGKWGSAKGGVLMGVAAVYFCCSENCSQVPVVATSKGAWYHCKVSFQGLFYIVECFVVGLPGVFYDFVGKGVQQIINFVYHGGHVCCV